MMIIPLLLFAWTATCWFSQAFDKPFLNLFLFDFDPFILLIATVLSCVAALVIWALRSGASAFKRLILFAKDNTKTLALLLMILIVYFLLQLPAIVMYQGSNDADSGSYGLAGFHIAEGKSRPMFAYGNHYVGAVIPHLAAGMQVLMGKSPVYLRLLNTLVYLGFIIVLFFLVRRILDDHVALMSAALAAIPPFELFKHMRYTEYPEILFWGTLSLLLLSKILDNDRPTWRQFFWYGVVLGMGFYTHPQFVYFIAVAPISLFLKDKLFFVNARFAAIFIGFFLGSIVTFIDSFYYNWAIFTRFFSQASDVGGSTSNFTVGIGEFLGRWPEILGLKLNIVPNDFVKFDVLVPWMTWLVSIVFVLCFIAYCFQHRQVFMKSIKFKNVNVGSGIILILVISVLLIYSFSQQSQPPSPIRYVFPLWIAAIVIIATASQSIMRINRTTAVAVFTLFMATFFWSMTLHGATIALREFYHSRWMDFCREEGITRFYGNWLRAYHTSFVSNEKVVGRDYEMPGWAPIAHYFKLIDHSGSPPAYLFGAPDLYLKTRLETHLNNMKISYRESFTRMGTVIHGMSERATPLQLADLQLQPYEASLLNWSISRVSGAPPLEDVRVASINLKNSGVSTWHADGRNGAVELVIQDSNGNELRRQPLSVDVEPGKQISWLSLLELKEISGRRATLTIRVNDIVINAGKKPLTLKLEPGAVGEKIDARDLDIVNAKTPSGNQVSLDYIYFKGWGAIKTEAKSINRWSSGKNSTLGFFISYRRPIELELAIYRFQGETAPDTPQLISITCNGHALTAPIYLPKSRQMTLEIPAGYMRTGINHLRFQYLWVEPEYTFGRGDPIIRYQPRAMAIRYLRFKN